MASRRVTVFGGSGFLGRQIVKSLAAEGTNVRVAVRHPKRASFIERLGRDGQIRSPPSACAMQCSTGPRSRLGPDHILGPHPGVELFFRQQPQRQRRLL